MRGATVYLLICADGSFYVGSTKGANIDSRFAQHQAGFGGSYTAARRPVTLAWAETFDDYMEAFAAERRLKGWSRAKKAALIAGDWPLIQALAKKPRKP
jgi:putative endonuclease